MKDLNYAKFYKKGQPKWRAFFDIEYKLNIKYQYSQHAKHSIR